jgi:7-cyano-7-deazaguanine synthase in queuosine biosynthesis
VSEQLLDYQITQLPNSPCVVSSSSGGLDSYTAAAIACRRLLLYALTINYNSAHELIAAACGGVARVARHGAPSTFAALGVALTSDVPVRAIDSLPSTSSTYVPARNDLSGDRAG